MFAFVSMKTPYRCLLLVLAAFAGFTCAKRQETEQTDFSPTARLLPGKTFVFNSFVDCNMAEAWVGDTFRIFPGKQGEDPVWGYANDLKFADGRNADEAFRRRKDEFQSPVIPKNARPGQPGLHGAVWFETVYQDAQDKSGKTLYAVYHNENYPTTLPYNPKTGEGYIDKNWPQGLRGPQSAAAVCRIGIMKSVNGGHNWANLGLFLEDLQPRMILKPHNTSLTFAGGVGDPSAVASGGYLYLFYGEYGYPGQYDKKSYDRAIEYTGQCISVARIKLSDLDNPVGKAHRWDGTGFNAPYNGIGKPIASIQMPMQAGGGAASSPAGGFRWGPSVSWNTYLNAWVMLMGQVEGASWKGGKIFISFNPHANLSESNNAQDWTTPKLLVNRPGHTLWYPSLQPMNTSDDTKNKATCLRLGRRARLFFKDMAPGFDGYLSDYVVDFEK